MYLANKQTQQLVQVTNRSEADYLCKEKGFHYVSNSTWRRNQKQWRKYVERTSRQGSIREGS